MKLEIIISLHVSIEIQTYQENVTLSKLALPLFLSLGI